MNLQSAAVTRTAGEGTIPPDLCECSRQSILQELKALAPEEHFLAHRMKTILGGSERCRFRISR